MIDKTKELIALYESILHGKGSTMGLLSCIDSYYIGCFDTELAKVEELKKEIKDNEKELI